MRSNSPSSGSMTAGCIYLRDAHIGVTVSAMCNPAIADFSALGNELMQAGALQL